MSKKTTPIGIRLHEDVKAALERAATADMRSQASMIEKLVIEGLRERGYLPAPDEEPLPAPKKTSRGKKSE